MLSPESKLFQEVETAEYEQCLYSWTHLNDIYPRITVEPNSSQIWTALETDSSLSVWFRRFDPYFQFISSETGSVLIEELKELVPMATHDDAEWTIEKHGSGNYLVRTIFTETFGPSNELRLLDQMLEPFGLWMENRGTYIWGAATFSKMTSSNLLEACQRLELLESWCIEANSTIDATLDHFWGAVRATIEDQISATGHPRVSSKNSTPKSRGPLRPSPK